jgi:hypothetical protein
MFNTVSRIGVFLKSVFGYNNGKESPGTSEKKKANVAAISPSSASISGVPPTDPTGTDHSGKKRRKLRGGRMTAGGEATTSKDAYDDNGDVPDAPIGKKRRRPLASSFAAVATKTIGEDDGNDDTPATAHDAASATTSAAASLPPPPPPPSAPPRIRSRLRTQPASLEKPAYFAAG